MLTKSLKEAMREPREYNPTDGDAHAREVDARWCAALKALWESQNPPYSRDLTIDELRSIATTPLNRDSSHDSARLGHRE